MPRLTEQAAGRRTSRELEGGAAPADFSEALARGLAVLEAFGGDARLSLADLARRLDLPRATVRRAVLTLEHLGFLRAEGRAWALTPQVLRLATAYLDGNTVSRVLQPACEAVIAELDAPCSVAVLDGGDAVMVARAVPQQLMAVGAGIGYRVPAVHSALGRVLLAARPAADVEAVLDARVGDPAERTRLRRLVDRVREQGWAYVADEAEPGHQAVAVPLQRWDGVVVAAMHVGAGTHTRPVEWMTGRARDHLLARAEELRPLLL